MDKEIKHLCELHDAFKIFIDRKNFQTVTNMMNCYGEMDDVNEINTILIITAHFKNDLLKTPFDRLKGILDNKIATLSKYENNSHSRNNNSR